MTPNPAPAAQQGAKVALHIEVTLETGEFSLTGPIENPMLFLGMLEMAKLVLNDARAKQNESRIAIAPQLPPNLKMHSLTRSRWPVGLMRKLIPHHSRRNRWSSINQKPEQ